MAGSDYPMDTKFLTLSECFVMNSTQVFEKRKIAVAIGIDLAKDHCDVVAYNADNKICFTKANMTYPKLRTEI